jgi:DNA-binding MarR family transcriptional regulator
VDATGDLLAAVKRFIQAADFSEERVASLLGIGRSDLRAVNLLESGPVSQADIARRLGLSRASVTALIDRLESHGLVRRTSHSTDRRVTLVELLPQAWERLAMAYRPLGMSVLEAAGDWTAPDRERLAQVLLRWADVFETQPQPRC